MAVTVTSIGHLLQTASTSTLTITLDGSAQVGDVLVVSGIGFIPQLGVENYPSNPTGAPTDDQGNTWSVQDGDYPQASSWNSFWPKCVVTAPLSVGDHIYVPLDTQPGVFQAPIDLAIAEVYRIRGFAWASTQDMLDFDNVIALQLVWEGGMGDPGELGYSNRPHRFPPTQVLFGDDGGGTPPGMVVVGWAAVGRGSIRKAKYPADVDLTTDGYTSLADAADLTPSFLTARTVSSGGKGWSMVPWYAAGADWNPQVNFEIVDDTYLQYANDGFFTGVSVIGPWIDCGPCGFTPRLPLLGVG